MTTTATTHSRFDNTVTETAETATTGRRVRTYPNGETVSYTYKVIAQDGGRRVERRVLAPDALCATETVVWARTTDANPDGDAYGVDFTRRECLANFWADAR